MIIKWAITAVCGITVILSGLWGGCWLFSLFPHGNPYNFAAFFTALVVTLIGVALFAFSAKQIINYFEEIL